jgi:hypothetical protein
MAEDRFEATIPKMIISVKEYQRLKEIEKTYLESQAHLKEKFAIKDKGTFKLSLLSYYLFLIRKIIKFHYFRTTASC